MGGSPSGSSSWTTLLNFSNMGFISSRILIDGVTSSLTTKAKYLLCLFWFHQEFTLVAYGYKFWLFFFCWLWNRWNRLHGNLLTLWSEHVDVSLASMGSIDIVLWSPQKYVICIHINNITSNRIFIKLANWNRDMTKICYLDRGASFDPHNSIRMMWLRLYL